MSVILIFIVVGLGFIIVGPLIGFLISIPFYPGNMMEFAEALQNPSGHPELRIPLYIIQGFATLIGLILVPALYLSNMNRRPFRNLTDNQFQLDSMAEEVHGVRSIADFFRHQKFELAPVLIVAGTVILFMAVNSIFVEWNANFTFPEFAKGFESWAREKEDAATELTEFLTAFQSTGELFIALLVIAVLPAIGEEIVFRGLIQNELYRGTRNIHLSIWISAILFSAIHFQFFGFVPRMLLGALFGYLYYWSGNLSLAMLAHFVNNGISVLALYFYRKGSFEYDVESPESAPAHVVMICAVATGGLLYYFYTYFQHRKPSMPSL
jgi:membrane protease YdiL (CAAX protease family)